MKMRSQRISFGSINIYGEEGEKKASNGICMWKHVEEKRLCTHYTHSANVMIWKGAKKNTTYNRIENISLKLS